MNQSLQGKTGGLRLRHHGAGRRDVGGDVAAKPLRIRSGILPLHLEN